MAPWHSRASLPRCWKQIWSTGFSHRLISSVSRKKWLLQASDFRVGNHFGYHQAQSHPNSFSRFRRILRGRPGEGYPATPIRGSFLRRQPLSGFASKALKNDGRSEEFELQKWITMDNWPTVFVTASAVSHLVNRVNLWAFGDLLRSSRWYHWSL